MNRLFVFTVAVFLLLAGGVADAVTVGWKSPVHLQVVLGEGEDEEDLRLYVIPLRAVCYTDPRDGCNYIGELMSAVPYEEVLAYMVEKVKKSTGVDRVWLSPTIFNVNVEIHHPEAPIGSCDEFVGEFEVSRFEYRIALGTPDPKLRVLDLEWRRKSHVGWMYHMMCDMEPNQRVGMREVRRATDPLDEPLTVEVVRGEARRVIDVKKLAWRDFSQKGSETPEGMEPPRSFFVTLW